MTTVSVLIATKDRPDDLAACLAALCRQSIAESMEVCVVNDGGGSIRNVARQFSALQLTWLDLPVSIGQVAARTEALKRACGEYIAFCDDDDRHLPTHLSRLMATLTQQRGSWAHAQAEVVELHGRPGHWQTTARQPFAFHVSNELLRLTNPVVPSSLLCRRDLLLEAGGLDASMGHYWDWDLVLRLNQHEAPGEVAECSVLYGVYPDRGTASSVPERMRSHLLRLVEKHRLGELPSLNFAGMLSAPWLAPYHADGIICWDGDDAIWNAAQAADGRG